MTTITGFAGRLDPHLTDDAHLNRVGLRHFPRRTMGVYRPTVDPSWTHRDPPWIDLTEPRRRYDAGWII